MIIHDDIMFKKDVIGLYITWMDSNQNPAIVGDFGQCWRCSYSKKGCSPEYILIQKKPSIMWPYDLSLSERFHFYYPCCDCRINEWCCMIDITNARRISKKHKIFFGNFYRGHDIGAKFFAKAVKDGYAYGNPIIETDDYYKHCWQGHSGNSVWVGNQVYQREMIIERLKKDFGYLF